MDLQSRSACGPPSQQDGILYYILDRFLIMIYFGMIYFLRLRYDLGRYTKVYHGAERADTCPVCAGTIPNDILLDGTVSRNLSDHVPPWLGYTESLQPDL